MSSCDGFVSIASAGVAPALRAVDCVASELTASAFNRLFGAEGAMAPVLTILLTLYIAFFAISLLTGRAALGVSALTPRMLTLGLVLTFATSWAAYQGVVWNLAIGAPDRIAAMLMGVSGSATQIFADRIDIVFAAIGELSQAAGEGQPDAQGSGAAASSFTPASLMWLAALLLLLGTVGVLLTARIALAVLLALGPVFVVMALFGGTRGLTAGWLRGVVLTGVTPLFVVAGGGITLELMVPVIAAMAANAGVSGRAAMALFLIASVHVALMAMMFKVAGTMVSGWKIFGLEAEHPSAGFGTAAAVPREQPITPNAAPPWAPAALIGQRSNFGAFPGADRGDGASAGIAEQGGHASERRIAITHISGGGIAPLTKPGANRTRGIGSRFRSASNDAGRTKAREMIR